MCNFLRENWNKHILINFFFLNAVMRGELQTCALASGSSGNCFYVGNGKGAVLIDAGISTKQICARMQERGLSPEKVRGIFVTHEHSDHVRGIDVFARKFRVPVFATRKTAAASLLCSEETLIQIIRNTEEIGIAGMLIEAFGKDHEAADPVSYTISAGKKRVSVITDLGHACKRVQEQVSEADFLFLESNHDVHMLQTGNYPEILKQWILSDTGHLSNRQAGLCVLEHASPRLRYVVLSHISEHNNAPQLALKTFLKLVKERSDLSLETEVSVRGEATKVWKI
jgi:phosphoribosyl 1,2-cyclic phosphodiesterase